MKTEFSRQTFEENSNIKFHQNPFSGNRVIPCGLTDGQTDMTKLIVPFRDFANAPKNNKMENNIGLGITASTKNKHLKEFAAKDCNFNGLKSVGEDCRLSFISGMVNSNIVAYIVHVLCVILLCAESCCSLVSTFSLFFIFKEASALQTHWISPSYTAKR
jgi:hypothetical protein